MDEKVMQAALEAGGLPGTPSEVRAIEHAYAAGLAWARHERFILRTTLSTIATGALRDPVQIAKETLEMVPDRTEHPTPEDK